MKKNSSNQTYTQHELAEVWYDHLLDYCPESRSTSQGRTNKTRLPSKSSNFNKRHKKLTKQRRYARLYKVWEREEHTISLTMNALKEMGLLAQQGSEMNIPTQQVTAIPLVPASSGNGIESSDGDDPRFAPITYDKGVQEPNEGLNTIEKDQKKKTITALSKMSDSEATVLKNEQRQRKLKRTKKMKSGRKSSSQHKSVPEVTSKNATYVATTCENSDKNHEIDDSRHLKKMRGDHPDTQRRPRATVSSLPGAFFASNQVRVIKQPGDGNCLFHSIAYGLGNGDATRLRRDVCNYISNNPSLLISETALKDWVKWDSGGSVKDYVKTMSWGGGIEMVCVSKMKQVNIHVYERVGKSYQRISAFDCFPNSNSKPIIRLLYRGGAHYGKKNIIYFIGNVLIRFWWYSIDSLVLL